jgi:hypothetical protein
MVPRILRCTPIERDVVDLFCRRKCVGDSGAECLQSRIVCRTVNYPIPPVIAKANIEFETVFTVTIWDPLDIEEPCPTIYCEVSVPAVIFGTGIA